jgi:hypothetical protein
VKEDSENVGIDEQFLEEAGTYAVELAWMDAWGAELIETLVAEVRRLRVELDARIEMS